MKQEIKAWAAIDANGDLKTDAAPFNDFPLCLISENQEILVRMINGDCDSKLDQYGRPKNPWNNPEHPEVGYHEGDRVVPIKIIIDIKEKK